MAHLLRGSWFVQIWINTTWECFNTSNSFQSILILIRIPLLIPLLRKWAPLPNLAYPTPGIMIWTKLCQLYPRKLPHKIQLFCLNGFWEEFTWENVKRVSIIVNYPPFKEDATFHLNGLEHWKNGRRCKLTFMHRSCAWWCFTTTTTVSYLHYRCTFDQLT